MRVPSYRMHVIGKHRYARVTINGKDHMLGDFDSPESHAKYSRLIYEYLSTNRSKSFGAKSSELQLKHALLEYAEFAQGYYRESSEFQNLKPIIRLMRDLYGDMSASEFGVKEFLACRQAIASSGGKSRQTVNKMMGGIESGILVRPTEGGELEHREGCYWDGEFEIVVGGWARVYRKNAAKPFYVATAAINALTAGIAKQHNELQPEESRAVSGLMATPIASPTSQS